MGKFAKLIDIDDSEQVLITVNYDDDYESFSLVMRTDLNGCVAETTLFFSSEEKAIEALEAYSVDDARRFRCKMEELLW